MQNLPFIVAGFLLFRPTVSFGQAQDREIKKWHNKFYHTSAPEIRAGKFLDLATEFTLDTFMAYYVEHSKIIPSKRDGDRIVSEVYRDSGFTYFIRTAENVIGILDFFKVPNNALGKVNYTEIDGNEIRRRFISEVVPEKDKLRVKMKERSPNCTTMSGREDFDYKWINDSNEIEVTYKWKITCGFIERVIKKAYVARYNIATRQFAPIEI